MLTEPSRDLAHLLRQAERLLAGRLAALLASEDCTLEEWRVLKVLADGHGHGLPEVAASAPLPDEALAKLMDRMVCDGLVYRRADDRDRRSVLVYLSLHGRDMYERAADVVAAADEQLAAAVGDDGELARRLRGLVDVLTALALVPAQTAETAATADAAGTAASALTRKSPAGGE
ncbi:MAG TPA: MarR family transcriptional regulator [Trebonia sp.]|jgi:DNA-binding MarR family transcriptional regulator|nr:MarR family transcriptional regulator [Trebonia sp.]